MKIIYRISDAGYNKIKPGYINNENCLTLLIPLSIMFKCHDL